MFSLLQLFGKGDRFFDLLEASAEQANASIQALVKTLNSPTQEKSLEEFVFARRKEKKIYEQISSELVRTFVTGLEREDIEALARALYKIPKSVEKFAERFNLARDRAAQLDFSRQVAHVEGSVNTLGAMVRELRRMPTLEKIKELNDKLQYLEGAADDNMNALLKELYAGKLDPIHSIIAKDLYELLEKIIDRCRDAGNVVTQIVLKHS